MPKKEKGKQPKNGEDVNLKQSEGTLIVSNTVLNVKKEKRKKITIRPFVTNPAHVSYKMGFTEPTGDYAGARVDVMLTVPCYVEELPQMVKRVREAVSKLAAHELDAFTNKKEE